MRAQLLPVARVIRFIRQNRLNRTVHQQIGIAADGRCEMRVIVVCQAEMAFVFRFIHRLLHGAQQHGLQGFAVRALGNLFRQFAVVFRFGLVTAAQTQPQQCQLFAQDGQFFGRGAGMVAVECFVLVAQQEICRAYIGCQHAFFNQFVRVVAVHFFNAFDFAVVVKNHLCFNGFKLHCATLATVFLQNLEELVQGVQAAFVFVVHRMFQPIPHLVVCQPPVRFHHGRIKLVRFHVACISNRHIAHHAQPLHVRIQRADAVGQGFRQHGDDAAREIHAGGPFFGICIDGVIGADIVAHVCNFFRIHGIIEIARSFAIDGYQRQVAQIHTVFAVGRTDGIGNFCRRLQAACTKFIRQLVFAQGNFDFHAAIGIITQNFCDFGHGRAVVFRITFNFRHYHLAGLWLELRHAGRFQNHVLVQPFVFRLQYRHAVIQIKTPHQ